MKKSNWDTASSPVWGLDPGRRIEGRNLDWCLKTRKIRKKEMGSHQNLQKNIRM
jgi:hypothetical protein